MDLGHGELFLVKLLKEVGDEVAVKDGDGGAFGVEPAPIGSREVEEVLEEDAVADEVLVADAEEFDVGGAGDGFGDVGLVRKETFEPQKKLAFGELDIGAFVGDQTVDGLVVAEEPIPLVDLDDGEAAVRGGGGGLLDDVFDDLHFFITQLEGGVEDHLGKDGGFGGEHGGQVLRELA